MARRLEPLTLANLDELPVPCRSCVFWELDPVAARQASRNGDTQLEKEAWLSQLLLDWGTAGVVLYVDDAAGRATRSTRPLRTYPGSRPSRPLLSAQTP